jgi:two-component system sensor histidine kinase/response regulator
MQLENEGQRLKVLLVEDDAGDAILLRQMLAQRSAEFDLAHVTRLDGALVKSHQQRFDVILLDLSLEDSEGIETFTTLRDGGSTAPIVVLTGFDDETTAVQAVREGAQDYLVKGKVDVDLLVRAIRYAIERQRTLTELENANRQISDFTAMMVHDLRSPLVNVIAIGDMVNDGLFGPLNDEQKKWLGRIVSSGHKLVALVTNLLDLSKLEAGHMEVIKKPADLEQLLSATLENYQILARAKDIILTKNLPCSPVLIHADVDRLEQVLSNLLSNALKFTPAGGEIEIGAAQAGNEARVWIKDTGAGIAPDEIGQLFEKYKQTTSGKNSTEQGTGLGLLICKMIVEAHSGRIWVESEEGKGTTFTFTLPTET